MNTIGLNDESARNRFHRGGHFRAYEMLGAHFIKRGKKKGVRFSVWTKNAVAVSVVGDFNGWDTKANVMERIGDDDIWETFVEGEDLEGSLYKFAITPPNGGAVLYKADPYAVAAEKRPGTASRLFDANRYKWHDAEYIARRDKESSFDLPMLIYEVHAGSWQRNEQGDFLTYRELADRLVNYAADMKYTHIEFLPLTEYPYDGSWGYQVTGYYAATSRFGTPDDFRYLVDCAHNRGIGIILDWVPGHFAKDEQGLVKFDGMPLYESDNPQLAENKSWGTVNFDYGRGEVQSFLISNAVYWIEEFHIDGLRLDGVANMLYLNFGRKSGEWTPNRYGGTGNLDAMDFLKKLNETVFKLHPQVLMIAEESTDWPQISKPVYMGGMGFNYKQNMGWTHDMLQYLELDPIYRKWNHDKVTFSFMYAFNENFVLPLSHDDSAKGKGSLIGKMPGDYWRQFAGLRGFFGYFMAHPGKKLIFMGDEFGQFNEWAENASLDWHLTEQYDMNAKMLRYSRALNEFYVGHRAFWQVDFDWSGFSWIDSNDNEFSVFSFIRKADNADDYIIVLSNFTPEVRKDYRIGVPDKGTYVEVFNSDGEEFGGSGVVNEGDIYTEDIGAHNRAQSIRLTVPPLATIYLRRKDAMDLYPAAVPENATKDVAFEREEENVWQPDGEETPPKQRVTRRSKKADGETAEATAKTRKSPGQTKPTEVKNSIKGTKPTEVKKTVKAKKQTEAKKTVKAKKQTEVKKTVKAKKQTEIKNTTETKKTTTRKKQPAQKPADEKAQAAPTKRRPARSKKDTTQE